MVIRLTGLSSLVVTRCLTHSLTLAVSLTGIGCRRRPSFCLSAVVYRLSSFFVCCRLLSPSLFVVVVAGGFLFCALTQKGDGWLANLRVRVRLHVVTLLLEF